MPSISRRRDQTGGLPARVPLGNNGSNTAQVVCDFEVCHVRQGECLGHRGCRRSRGDALAGDGWVRPVPYVPALGFDAAVCRAHADEPPFAAYALALALALGGIEATPAN